MTYESFLKILITYDKLRKDLSDLYNIGMELYTEEYLLESLSKELFESILKVYYTSDGIYLINQFIYGSDYVVQYSYESLWELLEKDYKL
jgi:hypothetical protein